MAILAPADTFDDVFQLETTTPVKGGAIAGTLTSPTDGQANASLQALTNRTYWLSLRLIPIGSILPYGGETAPDGFLLCNGASKLRAGSTGYPVLYSVIGTKYGTVNSSSFTLPDLRGQFIRGWDNGAGVDPDAASRTALNFGGATGDSIGTEQADAFEAHTHTVGRTSGVPSAPDEVADGTNQDNAPNTDMVTGSTGGNETRPTNVTVNFIIRADY